jgi:hypothetical protein
VNLFFSIDPNTPLSAPATTLRAPLKWDPLGEDQRVVLVDLSQHPKQQEMNENAVKGRGRWTWKRHVLGDVASVQRGK